MNTYQEYKAKISELQALAEEARGREISQAKEQIGSIMKEYGLTLADIAPQKVGRPKKPGVPAPVKYRDSTGQTWTGRGRTPKWLEGKDKNDYLVK